MKPQQETKQHSDYELTPSGSFLIRNYAEKKPFSNFLPGIAGLYGTPMWVFYVNRGQAVASFGTRNKDNAMLEFFPANKAYQMVSSVGFRTFLKIKPAGSSDDKINYYEPFKDSSHSGKVPERDLDMASHEFSIHEKNSPSGIETSVTYFTIPGEPIAALARCVTFTNSTSHPLELEILDGLPQVCPYGMNEFFMKHMSRTIEAWMTVENSAKKAPYFKLKVDATDRPEVTYIDGGNFFSAFLEQGSKTDPLDVWVDPAVIFGPSLDFSTPVHFFKKEPFKPPFRPMNESRTPCAFAHGNFKLLPGKSKTIFSLCGHARSVDELNRYLTRAKRAGYFESKRQENRRLIESLKSPIFTISSSGAFDAYCGQTFLDNIMRGGKPACIGRDKNPLVYYVYSRKHGDLERDYNRFLVEDSYFSQGDGNYRDVNQNRRHDVWFEPRVFQTNLRMFMNLLQLDGFNPLVVKGTLLRYHRTGGSKKYVKQFLGTKHAVSVETYLSKPFKVGEFFRLLQKHGPMTTAGFEKFLHGLRPFLSQEEKAEHGEGYWIDHWTYNLDLVESFLGIYPERMRELWLEDSQYTFYDDSHRVRSRDEKYFWLHGRGVRQYQAVFEDKEKTKLIESREREQHVVRIHHGKGEIYRTNLLVKILALFTNKLASLDAQGIGIEMEADKPSWYDALNGMPGLAGSSICEAFELKRLAMILIQCLDSLMAEHDEEWAKLPEELFEFMEKMERLLEKTLRAGLKSHDFWSEAATAKEKYRETTALGLSGREKKWPLSRIKTFAARAREKLDLGLEKAWDEKTGLVPTYFENEVVKHKLLPVSHDAKKDTHVSIPVRPLQFRQKPIPHFLEGMVHAIKVEKDPARRKAMYQAVRRSPLFDTKLGMYRVNAPMGLASMEIGRARVFTPGWLENESIWLHMEYKYLLEVLRAGLHEEFFQDMKKALIPFQPAERYARSVLENSSFIVSSVFPDAALHGAGFVARLSGSTAEFIHIWLLLNAGKRPFVLGPDGKVSLRFEPHLPAFLFTEREMVRVYVDERCQEQAVKVAKNSYAFLFLGKTLVVYSNPKRMDTFGKIRASVKKITLVDTRNRPTEFKGDTIPSPWALRVRDEYIPRIDIELG